jgi:beta-mannosidase
MSEFGFQSFPEMTTIAQFADSSQWHLDSDVMQSHQKHPRGNALILEYMQRDYPVPVDFDKFVYVSQILQAEGMRIGMEAHRRSQPYCMGTLYWQLNDCWPVASWSSRDYYGNWKALHYTTQEVFAPVALSIANDDKGGFSVWVMSELEEPTPDTLEIAVYDMNGNAFITNEVVRLPVNGVLKAKELNPLKRNQFMICSLKNSSVQSKTVFALPIKEMHFEQPNIQTQWKGDTLSLSTNFPAFQVYLHGIDGHFSDNFFTLLPNEKKEVVFEGEAHLYQLRIFSLANLFDK